MLTELQQSILDKIQEPSDRTKQRKIGPSQIGGCPFCLGKALALSLPEQYPDLVLDESSGLGAWIGTQVHYSLEHNLKLGVPEQKVFVYDLKGYGHIYGSIDLEFEREIFDFKVTGKYGCEKMALEWKLNPDVIPTTQYRVQQMLYAHAKRQAGATVEAVNLMVIPKLSNNFSDIRFYRELYNQEVVDRALERLDKIWEMVQANDLASIPPSEDCYNCLNNWRIV